MFIVDGGGGRLLKAEKAPQDRVHIDVEERLDNGWEAHERVRPSPLSGKDGHTYASFGHENEAMLSRFAKDAAAWLASRVAHHSIDRVAVMAPPRFLGALRQAWSSGLAARVEEHQSDLGYMGTRELQRHPLVTGLLDAGRGRR
jgi:protein required for attachment to host cells